MRTNSAAASREGLQSDLFGQGARSLYDTIPTNLTPLQRANMVTKLDRMACNMVDWFADRAFTCPDSLEGTIETYKALVVQNAHEAISPEHVAAVQGDMFRRRAA